MEGLKFSTWLGSLVAPPTSFYLIGFDETSIKLAINQLASIGYEPFIKSAFVFAQGTETSKLIDLDYFWNHPDDFTIVDVRDLKEVKEKKFFEQSIHIPLVELASSAKDLPASKPIVVHCAGGYRSAIASSMLQNVLLDKPPVFDLGKAVLNWSDFNNR